MSKTPEQRLAQAEANLRAKISEQERNIMYSIRNACRNAVSRWEMPKKDDGGNVTVSHDSILKLLEILSAIGNDRESALLKIDQSSFLSDSIKQKEIYTEALGLLK